MFCFVFFSLQEVCSELHGKPFFCLFFLVSHLAAWLRLWAASSLLWAGFNRGEGRGGDYTSQEAPLWPCLPSVALSRAGGTNSQLSLGTSSHGAKVRDEDRQVPADGHQPLHHGKQATSGERISEKLG